MDASVWPVAVRVQVSVNYADDTQSFRSARCANLDALLLRRSTAYSRRFVFKETSKEYVNVATRQMVVRIRPSTWKGSLPS
jgi:hypothetical protein